MGRSVGPRQVGSRGKLASLALHSRCPRPTVLSPLPHALQMHSKCYTSNALQMLHFKYTSNALQTRHCALSAAHTSPRHHCMLSASRHAIQQSRPRPPCSLAISPSPVMHGGSHSSRTRGGHASRYILSEHGVHATQPGQPAYDFMNLTAADVLFCCTGGANQGYGRRHCAHLQHVEVTMYV